MNRLSPKQFERFIQARPETIVLDVRFAYEREESGYLTRSHHLPWYTPEWDPNPDFMRQVSVLASIQQAIVVVCRSGNRSCSACELLIQNGYREVYNLDSGYEGLLEPCLPASRAFLSKNFTLPASAPLPHAA